MLEKEIEARLGKEVRRRGGLYYKFVSPGSFGVPDRIVITGEGRVVFLELKTETGRLSNLQKFQRDQLEKHKADVRVIRGWAEAESFLREVMPDGVSSP